MRPAGVLLLCMTLLGISGCAFEDYDAIEIDKAENNLVIEGITPEMRESVAYKEAMQAKNGTAPMLPLLYWSKFTYTPILKEGCWAEVIEKNMKREVTNTYKFDLCADEE